MSGETDTGEIVIDFDKIDAFETSRNAGSTTRLFRSGFTLLELLLTLSLVAIVASLTLPGLAGLLGDRRLARAGDQTAIEMNRARVDAMRQGRVLILEAELQGHILRLRPFFSTSDATEALDQTGTQSGLLSGASQGTIAAIHADEDADTVITLPAEIQIETVAVASTARDVHVSSQVGLTSARPSSDSAEITTGQWSTPILFYPDGTTSTAAITISQEGIGKVVVRLRGITGEAVASEVLAP